MTEISTIVDGERMTSLQIAEITGRRHTDVMRAIRKMEPAWEKVSERKFALAEYQDEQGKPRPCYSLNKEECLYIATKFNDEARAKLIKRWKELEEQHQKPSVPQNYLEALKSLVKSEEEKQQLASENKRQQATILTISKENVKLGNKITEMLPKVSYYDQILQSNATMTITQIAQDYGMSAIKLNLLLSDIKIQHKVRGQWILYGHFLHDSFLSLADSQHTVLEGNALEYRTTLQLSVELSKGSIITQKMLLVGWGSLPQSHLFAVLVHSLQEVDGTLSNVALWDSWSLGILRQIIILLPLVQVMLKLVIAQGELGITILKSSWAQGVLQKRSNHMFRQLGRDSVADDGMAQIL